MEQLATERRTRIANPRRTAELESLGLPAVRGRGAGGEPDLSGGTCSREERSCHTRPRRGRPDLVRRCRMNALTEAQTVILISSRMAS